MNKVWLSHYPAGVPHEIDISGTDSLVDVCDEACTAFADARAFGNFGSYLSFRDVATKSRDFAAFLQSEIGITHGDRVALMMPNILQYPVALFGALRAGAVVVNTNPQYTSRELRHQLDDAGASCIVAFSHALPTIHDVADELPIRHIVTTEIGDLFPFPKSSVYNRAARRRQPRLDGTFSVPVTPFNDALKHGGKSALDPPSLGPDDLAFLQYTGGTTGRSKGAMLSHGNIIANTVQVASWFGDSLERGREVVIAALPMYHIYALTVHCFAFFREGALNYLITDPRDTARFIKELTRVPFTGIAGVNTLFSSLLGHDRIGDVDFSHLKYTSGGGTAIQSAVADAWEARTGTIISQGYGLTEASPVVCVNPFELEEFTGCIGIPVPSTECRIVSDDGTEAAAGEPGELHVRGPQVMQGYWRREAETAEVLDDDGWLRTGDVAVMLENGYFRIVDRKKDLVIVSGFNVYPNEIEGVAVSHPGVTDAAAIGVPEPKTGESVKLVAVRSDPELTADALITHCRAALTAYKVPRYVEFVDELPKSPIGKVLRRAVKARYGAAPADDPARASDSQASTVTGT